MREDQFRCWLTLQYRMSDGCSMARRTPSSRISNCKTVERFEGELDAHFRTDKLQDLLRRLAYSRENEQRGLAPAHSIPINGNIRNGTNTYRSAVNLYRNFCESLPPGRPAPNTAR